MKKSIKISGSSTNLIRFNVEDILALPQLKSGKFTKNISDIDIKSATSEIVDLMEHQSEAKGVNVSVIYQGFPE